MFADDVAQRNQVYTLSFGVWGTTGAWLQKWEITVLCCAMGCMDLRWYGDGSSQCAWNHSAPTWGCWNLCSPWRELAAHLPAWASSCPSPSELSMKTFAHTGIVSHLFWYQWCSDDTVPLFKHIPGIGWDHRKRMRLKKRYWRMGDGQKYNI